MKKHRFVTIFMLITVAAVSSWPQDDYHLHHSLSMSATKTTYQPAHSPLAVSATALPSGFSTINSFSHKAFRFEILSVGAFPIMLLYTDIGFGLGRYIGSGLDSRYAPWPFQNSSSILPDAQERILRIAVAAGVSCAIALFDLISSLGAEAAARSRSELDSNPQPK